MSLKITRSPQALLDVIDRSYYIAGTASLNESDKFLTAVEAAYKQLAEIPGMGAPRDFGTEFPGLRMWHVPKFAKYLIFYQVTETDLIIRRVLYGSQNIEQIFHPSDNPSDED